MGFTLQGERAKACEPLAVRFRMGSRFTYPRGLWERILLMGARARQWAREEPAVQRGSSGGSGIPGLQVLLEAGWMPAAAAPGLESMCRPRRKNQKPESRRSSLHVCMGCADMTVYVSIAESRKGLLTGTDICASPVAILAPPPQPCPLWLVRQN